MWDNDKNKNINNVNSYHFSLSPCASNFSLFFQTTFSLCQTIIIKTAVKSSRVVKDSTANN